MLQTAEESAKEVQLASTVAILSTSKSPPADLEHERSKATFNVAEMAELLHGGKDRVEMKHSVEKLAESDPLLRKDDRVFLTREQRIARALQYSKRIRELVMEEGLPREWGIYLRGIIDDPNGMDLHWGMFLPTIESQGTPEQREKWFMKSVTCQILGTYAQTELGHGTFLRGLETTATYDRNFKHFVLHSPTLSATKWWPGGLGKTATHAVVMARLFIDGEDFGPHPFVVQLRDLKTHLPLEGIEIGDIGPKFGFTGVDNGFLRFNHVIIDRDAMLMRYAQVTEDGKYISPPVAKASYGTMVLVRASIVQGGFTQLSRAVTIAVRYAAVRRQTAPEGKPMETQIMDYQNLQYELFPLIATSYALRFTGNYMLDVYQGFVESSGQGNFDSLPAVHATSSGLKALTTWLTAAGIEVSRRCCGGHGYSALSGLPELYTNAVAACTYEGENNVMSLQTARYLVKALAQAKAGKLPQGNTSYLGAFDSYTRERFNAASMEELVEPEGLLQAFRHWATRLVCQADQEVQSMIQRGATYADAWNANAMDLIRASVAHCYQVMLLAFRARLDSMESGSIKTQLLLLYRVFALSVMEANLGDFMEDGYLSPTQGRLLRKSFRTLLSQVRPNAVALVDSFDHSDYYLCSALGAYDGDVYRRLYALAKKNPMNQKHTGPGYEETVRVMLQSSL